jgi:hypothetical protein
VLVVVGVEEVEEGRTFRRVDFEGEGEEWVVEGEGGMLEAEVEGGRFVVEGGVDCYGEGHCGIGCFEGALEEESVDDVEFVFMGGSEEVLDQCDGWEKGSDLVDGPVQALKLLTLRSYCSRGNLMVMSPGLHGRQRSGDRVSSAPRGVVGLELLRAIVCTDIRAFAGHLQVVHPSSFRSIEDYMTFTSKFEHKLIPGRYPVGRRRCAVLMNEFDGYLNIYRSKLGIQLCVFIMPKAQHSLVSFVIGTRLYEAFCGKVAQTLSSNGWTT